MVLAEVIGRVLIVERDFQAYRGGEVQAKATRGESEGGGKDFTHDIAGSIRLQPFTTSRIHIPVYEQTSRRSSGMLSRDNAAWTSRIPFAEFKRSRAEKRQRGTRIANQPIDEAHHGPQL